ncbi:hypothetical protein M758_3G104500 [Ceratodon purpureus]|uniref:Uncharacterized protein n=1 Tax=Ceratodon purpureus TaxID=3225 RepID=A0A8T0IGU6_CERPU|nr:hypothetical protein KC19_3G101500 [Ceratodon purpureus]KAG0622535.1 hypothetical protein M758_3G104500 [Ceratodon purpureus]
MAQCAMQMRAVVSLGDVGVLGVESRTVGAASRLASVSQGWRAANVAQLRVAAAGRVELQRQYNLVAVRAAGEPEGEGDGSGFGLGGKGAFFGFGRFQELQVGRLAMVGFAAAVIMEVITGKGVLGQLGINPLAVKGPFLAGFLFLLIGGLLGGYVVINNPPDTTKAPPNDGDGLPRNPLKTYDPQNIDPLTTFTRGGVVERPSGQKGKEPYVSDLDLPPPKN